MGEHEPAGEDRRVFAPNQSLAAEAHLLQGVARRNPEQFFVASTEPRQIVKIIVTSHNPVKIAAVMEAFQIQFPDREAQVIPLHTRSGVSDQPMSDEETRRGARNRVANARQTHPDADYWVGLEGGLDYFDGHLMAFAWMVVTSNSGQSSETRSVTLPLPPEVQELVSGGLELGEANDRVFSTLNSKQGGGAFGLLTDGLMTRESVYTQTLVLALIPFVHELWS